VVRKVERIRISGKDLGGLPLDMNCLRCFWVSRKALARLPYQISPGIFSAIDSYTKKIVHGWFDRNDAAPTWLGEHGVLRAYIDPPHFSKFQLI